MAHGQIQISRNGAAGLLKCFTGQVCLLEHRWLPPAGLSLIAPGLCFPPEQNMNRTLSLLPYVAVEERAMHSDELGAEDGLSDFGCVLQCPFAGSFLRRTSKGARLRLHGQIFEQHFVWTLGFLLAGEAQQPHANRWPSRLLLRVCVYASASMHKMHNGVS